MLLTEDTSPSTKRQAKTAWLDRGRILQSPEI